ncbi:hypothetical protein I3760_13G084900 [Carya illinoinensis]|nr:hypothetical protein I3760_13G084900 [Carya illinoinensis]
MEKQWKRPHRLVLVPCPFQGHINPMLHLGYILHSKGFSITISHTQFNFPNTANHPDFHFLPIVDGFSDRVVSSGNFIDVISSFNNNCRAPLEESLALVMETKEYDGEITCIIYDEYMYFAAAVAKHLKRPSIILRTSSAIHDLTYNAIPGLLKDGHISTQDADPILLESVPGLHPLRFKDIPITNFKSINDLLQLIANAHETRTSAAIIWNTMDCLEGKSLAQLQQQSQVPLFAIGPFHKIAPAKSCSILEEDTNCIEWLDKQACNSVIYISLGSIASMDKKELAEMEWGLANSQQHFLWVVRPDPTTTCSEWTDSLPEGFIEAIGERGCIVKWAPQKEVLAHGAVGGFWSHCGWNSTLEGLCEGVPMICQPYFGDQWVHARYLTQVWRTGQEWGDNMERGEIERAVRRLIVDKEGKEMRQRAVHLKEKIDICMSEGGGSYNSLYELVGYILSLKIA